MFLFCFQITLKTFTFLLITFLSLFVCFYNICPYNLLIIIYITLQSWQNTSVAECDRVDGLFNNRCKRIFIAFYIIKESLCRAEIKIHIKTYRQMVPVIGYVECNNFLLFIIVIVFY